MAKRPQARALSAVKKLIRSESREAARARAQEWLDAGWNPMIPQEGAGPGAPAALEWMLEEPSWTRWALSQKARFGELGRKAAEAGQAPALSVLLERACSPSRPEVVKALLEWGADPDEPGKEGVRPLFHAGQGSFEELIAFGADPAALGALGETLWEAWAWRCARRNASMGDLARVERVCPPPARLTPPGPGGRSLGAETIAARAGALALRMAQLWPEPETLGVESDNHLSGLLNYLSQMGDCWEATRALAIACGDERTARCAAREQTGSEYRGTWLRPAAEQATRYGRLKMLEELERVGLFEFADPMSLALRAIEGGEFNEGIAAGAAWGASRARERDKAAAISMWSMAAFVAGPRAAAAAERLAERGWLPDSGEGSLTELFGPGGERWDDRLMSFGELKARCEQKGLESVGYGAKRGSAVAARPRL